MKMRQFILTLNVLIPMVAKADYHCQNYETGAHLNIIENMPSHCGGDTVIDVDFQGGKGKIRYHAIAQEDNSLLYKKKVYDFFQDPDVMLAIISQSESCGHESCESSIGDSNTTALLKIGEKEAYFSCD